MTILQKLCCSRDSDQVDQQEAMEWTDTHYQRLPFDFPIDWEEFFWFCKKTGIPTPHDELDWTGVSVGPEIDVDRTTNTDHLYEALFELDQLTRGIIIHTDYIKREQTIPLYAFRSSGIRTIFWGEDPPGACDLYFEDLEDAEFFAKRVICVEQYYDGDIR